MKAVRRLSVVSTLATLVLVTIGGLVRATKSGLGCGTDWPHCSGTLVPALENRAVIIEFSHRLSAGAVVVLLGVLALLAWRKRASAPAVWRGSLVAFALVLGQALLGAVVVKLELEAASVVLHLATAMALLAALVYTSAAALAAEDRLPTTPNAAMARQVAVAAASILIVLLVGSYVSGRGAGLAFTDWPLMDGRLLPDLSVEVKAINWAHRVLAAGAGLLAAIVAGRIVRRRREMGLAARWAELALGALAVQMLVGAANVWTRLNPAIVTLHLLLASVIWSSLVVVVVALRPVPATREAQSRAGASRAALESGVS